MQLLDSLRGRMRQREQSAIDTIAAAARAAARGESYDVNVIENALVEARLSVEDFEREIERAGKRAAWLAKFDKLALASSKAAKIEGSIASENAKFEATRNAHAERLAAMEAELAGASQAREAGQQARSLLLDPQNVPGSIGERYRAAVAESEAAEDAVETLRRQIRDEDARIKSEGEWIAQLTGEDASDGGIKQLVRQRGPESLKVQDHRNAMARAERRKHEAETQLTDAVKVAASAKKAVEALLPDVLKA